MHFSTDESSGGIAKQSAPGPQLSYTEASEIAKTTEIAKTIILNALFSVIFFD